MIIFLCYGYHPNTTAVYFERALRKRHDVFYIGPGYGDKPGYDVNADLMRLVEQGLPMPDLVLFIESGIPFFPRGLEALPCPTACYLIDVHQSLWVRDLYAPFFDHIFLAQRDYVDRFRSLGYATTTWLPLACDPDLHGPRRVARSYDIGYVGGARGDTRQRRLHLLATHFTLNDWTAYWPKESIAEIYSRSKIVFNSSINGDLNMRVFEAMASGSMLLTDTIANGQDELFEDGVHFVQYRDDDDLIRQAERYLTDHSQREAIAARGRREVSAKHTYHHRCDTVLDTVFGTVRSPAPARIRGMTSQERRTAYSRVFAMLRRVDPVMDEFESGWKQGAGRSTTAFYAVQAATRRLNHITRFTTQPLVVRGRSAISHSRWKRGPENGHR